MRSARIFKLEDRGFLRVARDVKQPQDLVQEIEPEEQAGDLLIGEALFKEDEEDLQNEQLRNTSVAYLRWPRTANRKIRIFERKLFSFLF